MNKRVLAFLPWLLTGALGLFTLYHEEYKSASLFSLLFVIGVVDLLQSSQPIRRNYPLIGHARFILEDLRPNFRQYFLEGDDDEVPFSRMQRALVYERANAQGGERGFGTIKDVYDSNNLWLAHSIVPTKPDPNSFRIRTGDNPETAYDMSVFNISGLAFGALSGAAVAALNRGAGLGGFAQNTGEGGISEYHHQQGDLIWQIGSAYFGCRTAEGDFDPVQFEQKAKDPQVRMIEIKISQGAKPGHGGVLPGAKLSEEISRAWGLPSGQTCVCPASHSTFSTPKTLLAFVGRLRQLSGDKPVGIKICVGHPRELFALAKSMVQTNECPDFITVDGAEGGTGAAPLEFTDHVGMPLHDALPLVHATLVGIGFRHRVRLGASGKITSAFDIAHALALGADWCNAGRGFMFSLGCIQARSCHTDRCPTGIATQNPSLQRGIVVPDKAQKVASYHHQTLEALAELAGAVGAVDATHITAEHILCRDHAGNVIPLSQTIVQLETGALLDPSVPNLSLPEPFKSWWHQANPESF